ncbi:PAPA-1-like conserved region-domain-containing protein [Phyllosticta citribraziliensis]|uniref:PAPA-1-like conserved region-domain-containing protein n=1 Tax=Phyllosticta citribraziliensis TaxID=989973 RepID=A0ABR1M7V4_9PEZI
MTTRRLRSRAQINADSTSQPPAATSRPRRAAAAPTSATIERTSPEETRQSIHLTVKAAPNKLREVTSGATTSRRGRGSLEGGDVVSGQRASRNKKAIVEESSEEEDEDNDGEEDGEDDDQDEDLSEEEDADADEDVDMEDALPEPTPPAKGRGAAKPTKPAISISRPEPEVPSVEAKEMAMVDDQSDDEELSELEDSLDEEEGGEDEIADDDEEDDELDSDEETPLTGSRSATPDLSKLTRRQRGAIDEGQLLALSNEAQKKKHLTAEEHQTRRAEMARRRKNLSEKRNEEEKATTNAVQMDTINRLLKKQAPKRRTKAQVEADAAMDERLEDVDRAHPVYVRYVQTVQGSEIAVPSEWVESPVGELLRGSKRANGKTTFSRGRMVQEVA